MNWLLLFSLLFPSSRTTSCRTVYSQYQVRGPVRSVHETEIRYGKSGAIFSADTLYPARTLQFSRTGDTVMWSTPSFDGSIIITQDQDGGIVVDRNSRMRFHTMQDSSPRFRTTRHLSRYSSDCVLLDDTRWGEKSVAEFFTPQYDADGRLILSTARSRSDRSVVRTIPYLYPTGGGHIEQEEGRDDDGIYLVVSTYDVGDNLVREVRARKDRDDGTVTDTSVVWNYDYDRHGNPSRIARYLPGELSDTTLFEMIYDDHGNWIERTSYQRSYYNGHARIEPTEYRVTSVYKRHIEYYTD